MDSIGAIMYSFPRAAVLGVRDHPTLLHSAPELTRSIYSHRWIELSDLG
jgi:hypothetical protein